MGAQAKILVATTKAYWMPDDDLYLPVQVGATLAQRELGFTRDDSGENISAKNPRYCELTALYWGWKNLDAPALGLVHYRRHFRGNGPRKVLDAAGLAALLETAPVVVARARNYYIETVESHYAHTFDGTHFEAMRETLAEREPDFSAAFERLLAGRRAHICNMFVMRRDVLDAYCSWLFPLLADCEKRIDFSGLTPFEGRIMGRVAERLLDPWLKTTGTPFVECGVTNLERHWVKKGSAFLAAKFLGRHYDESF